MIIAICLICVIVSFGMNGFLLWQRTRYDGSIVVETDIDGKRTFSLELDTDPDDIQDMNMAMFKIVNKAPFAE